jgi:hypothetical protein
MEPGGGVAGVDRQSVRGVDYTADGTGLRAVTMLSTPKPIAGGGQAIVGRAPP